MGEPSTEPAGLKVPGKLVGPEGWYSTPPAAGMAWSWGQRERRSERPWAAAGAPQLGAGQHVSGGREGAKWGEGAACLGVGQGEGGHLGAHLDGLFLLLQAQLPLLLLLLEPPDGQLPLDLQVLLWAAGQPSAWSRSLDPLPPAGLAAPPASSAA